MEPKAVENMKRSWFSSESHGESIPGWSSKLPLNNGGCANAGRQRPRNPARPKSARFIMEAILSEQTTDRQQKFRRVYLEGRALSRLIHLGRHGGRPSKEILDFAVRCRPGESAEGPAFREFLRGANESAPGRAGQRA